MKLIKKFNEWKIEKNGHRRRLGEFLCNFCQTKIINTINQGLKNESCGCRRGCYRHGQAKNKIYRVWTGMIRRCKSNADEKHKKRYFDRGIIVCEEWKSSINFFNWAISLYKPGLELDRINNDKGYYPGNCRFTTRKVNMNNSFHAIRIKNLLPNIQKLMDDGIPQTEISKQLNVSVYTIIKYTKLGYLSK